MSEKSRTEAHSRRDKILDAAEALFAERGYDGVTLRQIAALAAVDVALTNYHFGTKKDLFTTVFHRRAAILNKVRDEALTACLNTKVPATLEDIVEAYLRPLGEIQASADKGWKHYLSLVAWVNNSTEWGREFMTDNFNPFVSKFIDALKTTLPNADEQALYWGYHYMSGALTLTFADTRRLDTLSGGKASSSDITVGYKHMIPFIAAGFRAICDDPDNSNS
ncbi:MAG: TetR/AcrR family transcriptional regulator [Hyphomonadaceae bacterium]|nr:TetR/AcrR family transcriptional regulator [Hyphomonadaceae bacterium]